MREVFLKRTGELVLGIIGVVLSFLIAVGGIIFIWAAKSEELKSIFIEEAEAQALLSIDEINAMFDSLPTIGITLLIASGIGIVLGLIAVISIKGNKKPKLAGILFIVCAILIGIITVGTGFLPALFYLIAGIMCFARKPPADMKEEIQY